MKSKRLFTCLSALVGAVVLTASSAGAHSGHTSSVTTTGSAITMSIVTGAFEPADLTIEFEAGWRFAHADGYGSELTPNPDDGTAIGSMSRSGAFITLLCATSTQNSTIYWEEDMTGAPLGAVARYAIDGVLEDVDAWVIEQDDATDDYKIVIDLNESVTCSTQPSAASISITLSQSAGGGVVYQDPSLAGCYDITMSFTDTSGGSHTGNTTAIAIGSASC